MHALMFVVIFPPPSVQEDRNHLLDAAIVRTMKSRRKCSLNELIAEVTKQVMARFLPEPYTIKMRIESLLEREYIARDEQNQGHYVYVA